MNNRYAALLTTAVVIATFVFTPPSGISQNVARKYGVVPGYETMNPLGPDGRVIPRKAIPRTEDGHPDFNGTWAGPGFTHRVGINDTDTPTPIFFDEKYFSPYAPGGETLFLEKTTGNILHDDPQAYCLPTGIPREILSPYPTEINQFPGVIIFRYEYMHLSRVVPTDGRPHSKNLELTFMGESVGKWEGDTLVIDTIGLRKWGLDGTSTTVTRQHTENLRVIEHIKYIDPMTADYQITIDDPQIFSRPWTQGFQMKLHPTWKIYEQICEENNRCEGGKCRN